MLNQTVKSEVKKMDKFEVWTCHACSPDRKFFVKSFNTKEEAEKFAKEKTKKSVERFAGDAFFIKN